MDLMHSDALNEDPNVDRLRAAGAEELYDGWRSMMPGRPAADGRLRHARRVARP